MKVTFNPTAAFIGATVSVFVGVFIFQTPAIATIVTSTMIGLMCGLMNWEK